MSRYIERLTISGPIDDVADKINNILTEIGFDIAESRYFDNSSLDQINSKKDDFEKITKYDIKRNLIIIKSNNDINKYLNCSVELFFVAENKTNICLTVSINNIHNTDLKNLCNEVGNKIIKLILLNWPASEMVFNLSKNNIIEERNYYNYIFKKNNIHILFLILFSFSLFLIIKNNEKISDEFRITESRKFNEYSERIIINNIKKFNTENRSDPPDINFILISVDLPSIDLNKCVIFVNIQNSPDVRIHYLELELNFISSEGWILFSEIIKLQIIQKDIFLSIHSKYLLFSKEYCLDIKNAKINKVIKCDIYNKESGNCKSIIKPNPLSGLPITM